MNSLDRFWIFDLSNNVFKYE